MDEMNTLDWLAVADDLNAWGEIERLVAKFAKDQDLPERGSEFSAALRRILDKLPSHVVDQDFGAIVTAAIATIMHALDAAEETERIVPEVIFSRARDGHL